MPMNDGMRMKMDDLMKKIKDIGDSIDKMEPQIRSQLMAK